MLARACSANKRVTLHLLLVLFQCELGDFANIEATFGEVALHLKDLLLGLYLLFAILAVTTNNSHNNSASAVHSVTSRPRALRSVLLRARANVRCNQVLSLHMYTVLYSVDCRSQA